jgi:hypothetical protein
MSSRPETRRRRWRRPQAAGGAASTNTFGEPYAGDSHDILWDVEGMFQFGDHAGQNTTVGAVCVGVGYRFTHRPMTPTLWLYNDWYSGDADGGGGPRIIPSIPSSVLATPRNLI